MRSPQQLRPERPVILVVGAGTAWGRNDLHLRRVGERLLAFGVQPEYSPDLRMNPLADLRGV